MTIPLVDLDDLPQMQPLGSGGKKKYPWTQIQPGQGFKFDAGVSLSGARSQVANYMRSSDAKFIVRLDEQDNIWCIRIDGLSLERREAWHERQQRKIAPVDVSDEMFGEMTETGPYVAYSSLGKGQNEREEHVIFPVEEKI